MGEIQLVAEAQIDPKKIALAKKRVRQAQAKRQAKEAQKLQRYEEQFAAMEEAYKRPPQHGAEPIVLESRDLKAKTKPAPKRIAGGFQSRPPCGDCGTEVQCMKQKAVWKLLRAHELETDPPAEWAVTHYCVSCWATMKGFSEEEALDDIHGAQGAKKRERAALFSTAMKVIREDYQMAEASNHKVRKLVRESELHEILRPLAQYVLLKLDLMEQVCKDAAKHTELVKQLRQAKSLKEEQAIMKQMEALEVDDKYLAFADKDPELQHEFIAAASYSDAWSLIYDHKGKCIGALLSWYICFGSTRDGTAADNWAKQDCCRIHASKDWNLKFKGDPMAQGQKWYCTCSKRYNASWGQLVQLKRKNGAEHEEDLYMRADCPNWDVEDVRAAWAEQEYKADVNTPMDLYNKVQRIVPATSSLVIEDPTGENQLKVTSKADFEALPLFSWWELFGIMGVKPPKGCKPPKQLAIENGP